MLNNLAEIGTIVNTHGIKGELRFAPINDQYYGYIIVGQNILIGETSYEVEKVRNHKKWELVTLKGLNNINDVEFMKASKVFVDESLIQDRSIFVDRVIGFKCFEKDFDLGIVKDYFQQGKNYSLILDLNGYIYNIPAVDEFIESIDEDKKIVLFKRGKELIINEN